MEHLQSAKDNYNTLHERIHQLEMENAGLSELLHKQISTNKLKDSFLAEASHELRSPLTNIKLSASLIAHYYDGMDREKIFGHLTKINYEVNRFVVVLNNYLLTEQEQSNLESS